MNDIQIEFMSNDGDGMQLSTIINYLIVIISRRVFFLHMPKNSIDKNMNIF